MSFPDDKAPIILDGGNLIHNGEIGFVSARILKENYDKEFDELDSNKIQNALKDEKVQQLIGTLKNKLNLDQVFILPVEDIGYDEEKKPEATGHLDGTIRFLTKDTIIIDEDYYEKHKKFLNEIFKNYNFKKHCIKQSLCGKNNISAKGIILNYLRIEDTIFLPKFKNCNETQNNNFKKICEGLCIKCEEVEEDGSISDLGGVFNCISWVY